MDKHEKAREILKRHRLIERLAQIGTPSLIGSAAMGLMVSNDIDIDVDNSRMSAEQLYALTGYILSEFHPTWYEAKEERSAGGETVWFHGFEAVIDGELWNFDIWFFSPETIQEAEACCEEIARKTAKTEGAREAILSLKAQLIEQGLYSFDQYKSTDVYAAVLEHNIRDLDAFFALHKQT